MKKFIFLCLSLFLAILAVSAASVNPVQEVNYRTDNNTPTKWTFVKVASATNAQFEVRYSARIFAVQSWAIPGISNATELKIYYTRVSGKTNAGPLCMWPFPYEEVLTTTDFSTAAGSFLDNVKTVFGAYPGNDLVNQPLVTSAAGTDSLSKYARVLTFDSAAITALKNAGTISHDTLYVNMLISTLKSVNDQNFQYYSVGNADQKPYMTVLSVAPESAITNLTKGKGYTDLATAVADADSANVLQLNEDVTVSGNRIVNSKAITIQGKTGAEKILRDTKLDNMVFLPSAELTLKDLVLDGQNIDRKKAAVETTAAKVIFDNVTIQNFKRTAAEQKQGVVSIKTKGKAVLNNVTFSNNAVLAGYGDVFVGLNKVVTLSGNNTIPNGIFLEKDTFAIIDDATTHTKAIDLRVPDTRKLGEESPIVIGTTDKTKYNLIASNPYWKLSAEGKDYLYVFEDSATDVNTLVSEEQKTKKVIENGMLIIIRDGVRYNSLGEQL